MLDRENNSDFVKEAGEIAQAFVERRFEHNKEQLSNFLCDLEKAVRKFTKAPYYAVEDIHSLKQLIKV
jgi:hypothetical protein